MTQNVGLNHVIRPFAQGKSTPPISLANCLKMVNETLTHAALRPARPSRLRGRAAPFFVQRIANGSASDLRRCNADLTEPILIAPISAFC
jgi:hypothetical protein